MSDISCRIVTDERYEAELNSLRIQRNAAWRENEKLRELVEDMLDCIEIRAAFNRPPTTEMHEQFAKRASELGVEVES